MMSPTRKYLVIAGGALVLVGGAFVLLSSHGKDSGGIVDPALARAKAAAEVQPDDDPNSPFKEGAKAHGPQVYEYKPNENLPKVGIELRPMDIDIFEAIAHGSELKQDRLTDLFPDKPYLVKMSRNALDNSWVNFVLIDLDRDGNWDEKWDLRKDGVIRYLKDEDGAFATGIAFRLRPGRWLPY